MEAKLGKEIDWPLERERDGNVYIGGAQSGHGQNRDVTLCCRVVCVLQGGQ